MNPKKIGGLTVLLLGVPLGLLAADRYLLAVTASIGLQLVFFAKERVNDERVQQLKMKAMFVAMSTGAMFALLGHYYFFRVVAGLNGDVRASVPTMTVWEYLASILLIALALFHYWRWQDAWPSHDAS